MKKFNAQAERPSNRAGLPRASRPFFFLFIHRLQAQAHSNRAIGYALHLPTPTILNRLQAQAS